MKLRSHFMSQDSAKKKALELAISQIEKQFGEGAIMALGKHSAAHEISVITTGAVALDIALGIGGVPRGRIIEIFGPESSGKSTLATHIVANAQKNGGLAAYIDAEHALDPSYAAQNRRQYRRTHDLPARLWRRGPQYRGNARPIQRHRRHRDRLGSRARAQK